MGKQRNQQAKALLVGKKKRKARGAVRKRMAADVLKVSRSM